MWPKIFREICQICNVTTNDDRPHRTTGSSHDDRDEQAKRFMKSLLSNASRSRTKEADVIKLVSMPEPA